MNDSQDHPRHEHRPAGAPESGVEDVGSRALSEALGSSLFFVKVVMVLLVVAFIFSGAKRIQPGERAIVFRFGKPRGEGDKMLLQPGLHFAFPAPIDEVRIIKIGKVQNVTSTVGWYYTTPAMELAGTEPPAGPSLNPAIDGYALTSDGNIIHVRATISYRITDALAYEFSFAGSSNLVQSILDNALVWTATRTTVDDAIKNSAVFNEQLKARVTRLADDLQLGITIDTVSELKIIPPRYIKQAFEAVLAAEVASDTKVKTAQADAVRSLTTAQSDANTILNAGRAEQTRYLKEIASFASSYSIQLPEYQKNPELFRQRLLTETWGRVLANAKDKWFQRDSGPGGATRQLWLQLGREPAKPNTAEPVKPKTAEPAK